MIKEAKVVKEELCAILKTKIAKLDDYDYAYEAPRYEHIINGNFENLYVSMVDNKIMDLMYVWETYGIKTVSPHFLFNAKSTLKALHDIQSYLKDCIFMTGDFSSSFYEHFTSCNMQSSFCEKQYHIDCGSYAVFKNQNADILRDAIETSIFKNIDENNLSFEFLTDVKEIQNALKKKNEWYYPMWGEPCHSQTIVGFHYLQPDFQENNSVLFSKSNGVLVGAIKLGKYQMEEMNGKYRHCGLCYIDVNYKYRKRGIAKQMIQELTKYVSSDLPFVMSYESDMGKECHMEDHFKAVKWNTEIYTSKEWEQEWRKRYVEEYNKN